MIIYP